MLARIRSHISYANVIAVIALVFAMTGGAYAAKKYIITSTSQIKPSVLKSLQGKTGPAGAPGVQGPQGPAGTNGAGGPEGPKGANGNGGVAGPAGKAGATGPEGVCSTASCVLPSGASETGTWALDLPVVPEEGLEFTSTISFPIRLKEGSKGPEAHTFYFNKAETTEIEEGKVVGTSGCKVENKTIPVAPKGVLCVFTEEEHFEKMIFRAIIPAMSAELGLQYGTAGAFVVFKATGEPASIRTRGVWAVTAP